MAYVTNPDFGTLLTWTNENTDAIAEAILNTDDMAHVSVVTGESAGTRAINIFSGDYADSDRACDFETTNQFTFDQVDVTISDRQIKHKMCISEARSYWVAARMNASAHTEELPFADAMAQYLLDGVKKNINDYIGSALRAQVTTANGAQLQGGTPAALTVSNALEQLNDLYDACDERVKMMDDVKIWMSPSAYRTAVRAIVAQGGAGFFHYDLGDGQGTVTLPGTNAVLVKSSGFVGEDTIICGPAKYAIFVTGLTDDLDRVSMFYDQGEDILKLAAYYRRGLGVYSKDQWSTNGL
jgi:hypothetical protein